MSDLTEERELAEEARRERIRIEVYRAAALIYARNVGASWDSRPVDFTNALHDAIELWDAMDKVPRDKRPY